MNALARILTWSGIVLLVLTAVAHTALGLRAIIASEHAGKLADTPMMAVSELKAFWVVLSTDLVVVAVIVWYCSFREPNATVVKIAGTMPLWAAFVSVWFVGLHIGVVLLSACGLLVLLGARRV
jgi:hypothetical protein